MTIEVIPGIYSGKILVPPSKSISQRAILLSLFCDGKSIIKNVGHSSDEKTMLNAIKKLGAKVINNSNGEFEIWGLINRENFEIIEIYESALSFRLLLPCLALFKGKNIIKAQGSLKNRPMGFFENVLPLLGIKIKTLSNENSFEIEGPIQANDLSIDLSLSSQFLSGLLISLSLSNIEMKIETFNLNSRSYINLTLDVLKSFGIKIIKRGNVFNILSNQKVKATKYVIENDWSSASFFLVASALGQNIELCGLNILSKQADKEILKCFKKANCEIIWKNNILLINGTNRSSFSFNCTDCPDLIPILSVFAVFTDGISKIRGAKRLIYKESNRLLALITEWKKLGVNIIVNEKTDEIIIEGKKQLYGNIMIDSYNDHRIAMSFAIAGMFTEKIIKIKNPDCVNKSYPDFWNNLNSLYKSC